MKILRDTGGRRDPCRAGEEEADAPPRGGATREPRASASALPSPRAAHIWRRGAASSPSGPRVGAPRLKI